MIPDPFSTVLFFLQEMWALLYLAGSRIFPLKHLLQTKVSALPPGSNGAASLLVRLAKTVDHWQFAGGLQVNWWNSF